MIWFCATGITEVSTQPLKTDAASMKAHGLDTPFAEIVFDFKLTPLVQGEDNQIVDRPRLAA